MDSHAEILILYERTFYLMPLSYWGSYECVGGFIWNVLNYDGPTSQFPLQMRAITCRQLQTTFHNLSVMIYGFLNVILGL